MQIGVTINSCFQPALGLGVPRSSSVFSWPGLFPVPQRFKLPPLFLNLTPAPSLSTDDISFHFTENGCHQKEISTSHHLQTYCMSSVLSPSPATAENDPSSSPRLISPPSSWAHVPSFQGSSSFSVPSSYMLLTSTSPRAPSHWH